MRKARRRSEDDAQVDDPRLEFLPETVNGSSPDRKTEAAAQDWLAEFADEPAAARQPPIMEFVTAKQSPPRQPVADRTVRTRGRLVPALLVEHYRLTAAGLIVVFALILWSTYAVGFRGRSSRQSPSRPVASGVSVPEAAAPAPIRDRLIATSEVRDTSPKGPAPTETPKLPAPRQAVVPITAPPERKIPARSAGPTPPPPARADSGAPDASSVVGVLPVPLPAVLAAAPVVPANEAPAPPSPPPVPARASDSSVIQGVLERYRYAFNTLQASMVEAFWPGVDSTALGKAFDRLDSQFFEFETCGITIAGGRAEAACRGTATFVPKVGSRKPKVESRRWTFRLSRAGDKWQIDSVVSR